jgi:hypothetical protein
VGKRGKEAPDGVMQQRLSVSGAANGSPRPHASRRPESATKPSVGDMRYQYPLAAAVMAGQNIKMQVEIRDHLCSSWRYRYTPWRLVMRATLLCCVAHTCPSMEYMPPHMPLKQGAYEHVRIRSELRVRTVAFAPYIGNPAAFLLSLGPTYRHCSAVSYVKQSNGPCWVSFKAGELQRARRCGSVY